ncbi:MAG: hypothetical protein AAF441_08255 [Pseudomonadota bacterium]
MGVVRWIFAVFGALIMLFAGGCSIILAGSVLYFVLTEGFSKNRPGIELVLPVLGLVPFGVGFLIWWLAARADR